MRLDAEKLEVLRGWGEGLSNDGRDEVRSAGRAILLLIDEIERLHIDLWHLRAAQDHADDEPEPDEAGDLESSLRSRLARWLT